MSDIRIERMLYGPRDRVLHAWRTPELLAGWFSPDPGQSVMVDADFHTGGLWRVTMGDDVVRGTYTEMNLPDRFAFTWSRDDRPDTPDSTVVVILTARSADSTELLLEHRDLADGDEADERERAWTTSLERLDQLVRQKAGDASYQSF